MFSDHIMLLGLSLMHALAGSVDPGNFQAQQKQFRVGPAKIGASVLGGSRGMLPWVTF